MFGTCLVVFGTHLVDFEPQMAKNVPKTTEMAKRVEKTTKRVLEK